MGTLFGSKEESVLVEIAESDDNSLLEYLSDTKTAQERFSVKEVAVALDKAGGFITYTARLLKCRVETVRRYIRKYPQLGDLVHDIKDFRLDTSEVELFKKIKRGDNTAIIFHLKCHGKARGYIDNAAINFNVGLDPNKANWKEIMDDVFDAESADPACPVSEDKDG